MNTPSSQATKASAGHAASYALLRFEQTRLLVPQSDIRLLELRADIELDAAPPDGVGWVQFRQRRAPVYCLTSQLRWTGALPPDRTVCAVLEAEGEYFGLMCSDVSIVRAEEVTLHEVPAAMRQPQAPFQRLGLYGEQLVCVSSVAQLKQYLPLTNALQAGEAEAS